MAKFQIFIIIWVFGFISTVFLYDNLLGLYDEKKSYLKMFAIYCLWPVILIALVVCMLNERAIDIYSKMKEDSSNG